MRIDILGEKGNELYVDINPPHKLNNSEMLANFDSKLGHLPDTEKKELATLISDYECLYSNVPSQTTIVFHDVYV